MQDLWDGGRDGEPHESEMLPRHENIRTTNGREREWHNDQFALKKRSKLITLSKKF